MLRTLLVPAVSRPCRCCIFSSLKWSGGRKWTPSLHHSSNVVSVPSTWRSWRLILSEARSRCTFCPLRCLHFSIFRADFNIIFASMDKCPGNTILTICRPQFLIPTKKFYDYKHFYPFPSTIDQNLTKNTYYICFWNHCKYASLKWSILFSLRLHS